ncbi:MAG: hypothetical protein ACI38R_11015 [Rhodococcus sp. (in: high G+C Gram-positive bacteria)]
MYVRGVVSDTPPVNPTPGMVWFGPYAEPEPPVTLATVADLAARWDADSLGADGTAIPEFAPTSGTWTTKMLAPGAAPTVKANAINGHKAVKFTAASSQYFDLDHPDVAGNTTIFAVFNLQTELTGRVFTGINTANFRGLRASTTAGTMNMNSPGGYTFNTPWTPAAGWCVAACVHAGQGNSKLYFNKLSPETGNSGNQSTNPMTDLRFARGSAASTEYANLELADFSVVTRACTDKEIKDILGELATKYALTLGA